VLVGSDVAVGGAGGEVGAGVRVAVGAGRVGVTDVVAVVDAAGFGVGVAVAGAMVGAASVGVSTVPPAGVAVNVGRGVLVGVGVGAPDVSQPARSAEATATSTIRASFLAMGPPFNKRRRGTEPSGRERRLPVRR
jgi:hypothetical protein